MKTEVKEIARNDKNCELRLGVASWDDGYGEEKAGVWLDEYYDYDDDGRYDAWS